jgi:hypothetical protein
MQTKKEEEQEKKKKQKQPKNIKFRSAITINLLF